VYTPAPLPRPRLHLIRFGVRITSLREVSGPPLRELGVLAPNANLRAQVVPQKPEPPAQAALPAECEPTCAHHRPVRLIWAKWLKRVFEIDMAHCPNCDGQLKIIAANLEQPVIGKMLTQPGSAGPGTAACASPSVAAASGLRSSSQDVSSGPVLRAAGTACARASRSRGLAADREGKPGVGHHG